MELSPSWEAVNCAATQGFPNILWNPKFHYRAQKKSPPHQSSPYYPFYLRSILTISTHLHLGIHSGLSLWLSDQYPICIPLRPYPCYMPCPFHPPWLDHSKCTWRTVHITQSSAQIFSSAPYCQTPSVYVPPLMSEITCHAHKNHG
jgi:hypothetical protein